MAAVEVEQEKEEEQQEQERGGEGATEAAAAAAATRAAFGVQPALAASVKPSNILAPAWKANCMADLPSSQQP